MAGLSQVGEVEGAREIPDLGLAEPGVDERRAHAALPRRGHAGTVVAEIVHRRAVREVMQSPRPARAARAARRAPPCRRSTGSAGFAAYSGLLELPGLDHHVAEADASGRAAAPPRARPRRSSPSPRSPARPAAPGPPAPPSRGASSPRRPRRRPPRSRAPAVRRAGGRTWPDVSGATWRQGVGGAARFRAQPASSPGRRDSAPRCRRGSGASVGSARSPRR